MEQHKWGCPCQISHKNTFHYTLTEVLKLWEYDLLQKMISINISEDCYAVENGMNLVGNQLSFSSLIDLLIFYHKFWMSKLMYLNVLSNQPCCQYIFCHSANWLIGSQ